MKEKVLNPTLEKSPPPFATNPAISQEIPVNPPFSTFLENCLPHHLARVGWKVCALFGVDTKNGVGQSFTLKTVGNLFKKCQKLKSRNFSGPNILYIIGKLSKTDKEDFSG